MKKLFLLSMLVASLLPREAFGSLAGAESEMAAKIADCRKIEEITRNVILDSYIDRKLDIWLNHESLQGLVFDSLANAMDEKKFAPYTGRIGDVLAGDVVNATAHGLLRNKELLKSLVANRVAERTQRSAASDSSPSSQVD